MKILMVYPDFENTFWSFKKILRFLGKKAAFPVSPEVAVRITIFFRFSVFVADAFIRCGSIVNAKSLKAKVGP